MVTLSGADGARPAAGPGSSRAAAGGRIEGDGNFWIGNVAPGRYQLQARAGDRAERRVRAHGSHRRPRRRRRADGRDRPGGPDPGRGRHRYGRAAAGGSPGVQVVARPATPDGPIAGQGGGGGGTGHASAPTAPSISATSPTRASCASNAAVGVGAQGRALQRRRTSTDVPLDVAPGQVITGVEVVITKKLSHAEGTVRRRAEAAGAGCHRGASSR